MANQAGDARTNTETDAAQRLGARSGESIYLGRHYDLPNGRAGAELFYSGDRHMFVFGPTGSGKGARFLIPNLLCGLAEQSVIVIDPKGEAAAVTAAERRRKGHDVIILNPFNTLGLGSAGFDPLAALDPDSPNFYDDASAIGEALIKIEGNDPHWSQSAQALIVALLMWEKKRKRDRATLENVRTMLTEGEEFGAKKKDSDGRREPETGIHFTCALMADSGEYEMGSLATRFIANTRENASILSTANTQTRWLLSPPIRADLGKNGLDFGALKRRPTTVYVILPAERLRTHSAWLRLVIVSALRSLYKPGGTRAVMLIDEMAALGPLPPLEDAFGLVRGYNVQIVAMLQDLGQLKELYEKRWETFIANAGVVFGFAPNDLTTADWMSKRSGQTTVVAKGVSQSSGISSGEKSSTSSGMGSSDQQMARPLLLPHELIGMEQGMALLWLAGDANTTRVFAPDYGKIRDCSSRAAANPYRAPG
jgi:type IV secretion system protein VirD4